ncbi:Pyranose oxidase [Gigaspora rosea]|uniref:Pyranose oxidase n=1 Tax=Gigaspora rosea TaxID=44941 RepID=A0A397U9K5_9GLOM|nr:Pyranose oxidase [Gigaspora rosea]
MGTHWTCVTPRLRESERFSNLIPDEEMDELYEKAENYLHTSKDPYNNTMLQTTVLKALKAHYGEDIPQALPLAVRFKKGDKPDALSYNFWTGPYDILRKENFENKNFTLMDQHLAQFLRPKINNTSIIDGLMIKNLLKPDNNKILLNKKIVKEMLENPTWSEDVKKHKEAYPKDPIPIPFGVPLPQCWIPYTDKRPWHVQAHRDSYAFGETSPNVDNRVILDFRYFGASHNNEELNNRVEFSKENKDMFGMPQPTFYVRTSESDDETNHKMLNDMTQTALSMGGFLPGNEPQFMPPGSALHITGTVRMGTNRETSVVDTNLCVHGFHNLYLGTAGVIPTAITANPTLTSVALAIKSANHIIKKLKEGAFDFESGKSKF